MDKKYFEGSDGLRLAASVGGDPKGEPVLFLHGAGQTDDSSSMTSRSTVAPGPSAERVRASGDRRVETSAIRGRA